MTDFWLSRPKHFCSVCSIFLSENSPDGVQRHEKGQKHQKNIQEKIKKKRENQLKEKNQQWELEKQLKAIEEIAQAKYLSSDVPGGAEPFKPANRPGPLKRRDRPDEEKSGKMQKIADEPEIIEWRPEEENGPTIEGAAVSAVEEFAEAAESSWPVEESTGFGLWRTVEKEKIIQPEDENEKPVNPPFIIAAPVEIPIPSPFSSIPIPSMNISAPGPVSLLNRKSSVKPQILFQLNSSTGNSSAAGNNLFQSSMVVKSEGLGVKKEIPISTSSPLISSVFSTAPSTGQKTSESLPSNAPASLPVPPPDVPATSLPSPPDAPIDFGFRKRSRPTNKQ